MPSKESSLHRKERRYRVSKDTGVFENRCESARKKAITLVVRGVKRKDGPLKKQGGSFFSRVEKIRDSLPKNGYSEIKLFQKSGEIIRLEEKIDKALAESQANHRK